MVAGYLEHMFKDLFNTTLVYLLESFIPWYFSPPITQQFSIIQLAQQLASYEL